jgi:hypothetical protein
MFGSQASGRGIGGLGLAYSIQRAADGLGPQGNRGMNRDDDDYLFR